MKLTVIPANIYRVDDTAGIHNFPSEEEALAYMANVKLESLVKHNLPLSSCAQDVVNFIKANAQAVLTICNELIALT